jgi:hypothetical protein
VSRFINKKSAVVALVATAMLGGGVAFAYPPSSRMTVAATGSSDGSSAAVVVTVNNANPTCKIQIRVEGSSASAIELPGHGTTFTHPFTIPGLHGRHSVTARTKSCPKGSKEHAKNRFVVLTTSNHVSYPPGTTVPRRSSYVIRFSGLVPNTTGVAVIATGPGGQKADHDTVDRRGEASLKLKFRKAGTWTLVTTISPAGGGSIVDTKTIEVS